MDINKFKQLIKERNIQETEYFDEWTEKIEEINDKMVNIICEDMENSILYLTNECLPEEFVYLSEIFDKIVLKTQNKKFIDTFYFLANKYSKETQEYNIMYFIDYAKGFLNQGDNNEN